MSIDAIAPRPWPQAFRTEVPSPDTPVRNARVDEANGCANLPPFRTQVPELDTPVRNERGSDAGREALLFALAERASVQDVADERMLQQVAAAYGSWQAVPFTRPPRRRRDDDPER